MITQTRNVTAAVVGALAGVASAPRLPDAGIVAGIVAALLIVYLGNTAGRCVTTPALCGVLGLACATLTVSLVS